MMAKTLICFAALIMVAIARAPCPADDDPNSEAILFADRANCAAYYECSHGTPYKMLCPVDLYYDIPLKTCNYKAAVTCGFRPEPQEVIPYDA